MYFLLLALCTIHSIMKDRLDVMNVPYCDSVGFRKTEFSYVYDIYKKHNPNPTKFVSNDTDFSPLPYQLKQNMMWNHRSVCSNDTFMLIMYYTYKDEYNVRSMIRQYVKQGMVVGGKRLNYAIVVAAGENETAVLVQLQKENDVHHDLLVSIHEDIYAYWPITVLDSFMWARDNCKQASYISKIDGDTWVHLGNLVRLLVSAPRKQYYGGRPVTRFYKRGRKYKGIRFIPNDYDEREWSFNLGACCVFSKDVVPYLNIGSQFMDLLFPACEDVLVGEILHRGGISPHEMPKQYIWILFHEHLRNMSIPRNALFVHVRHDFNYLKKFYAKYAKVYKV